MTTELNVDFREDFLPIGDELFDFLLKSIVWDESMKARKTASFGQPYNYSQMSYDPVPLPERLVEVRDRLESTLKVPFNNCLLNYYETGDNSMGYHSDETFFLFDKTGVAIVSLGSSREISFRSKTDETVIEKIDLSGGSLLYMDQEVQDNWMHAIQKAPGAGPRISLTWRAIDPEKVVADSA